MSNIYIQGPPAMAKVTMKTTVGDIKLEMWAKETPKACRNFIQLCVEVYYHDSIFHTQGGDPTGTGESGKIYREPFKNGRLLYPPRLLKSIILNNPFSVIISRIIVQRNEEEDEEESVILNKKFSGKGKSAHDHLSDTKLSSQPPFESTELANKKRKAAVVAIGKMTTKSMKKRIKNTLRDTKKEPKKVQNYKIDDVEDDKGIKENE
ncbi:Peptidyl-prolyl cis-trans isomerase CWC27 like protein [Eufriesea mexicana]|uniref:Spliceosome-associated protein CWC27 homolog n=1 Tax=Eufriesea mexicana TaxID=516756 RepID=A0A310SG97_9HYME|nr:Peptidyl-prolyl cis-trans isomerase CWC27 like protein [Eufriesea mexicana]